MVPFNEQEENYLLQSTDEELTVRDRISITVASLLLFVIQLILFVITTPSIIYKKLRKKVRRLRK